MYAGCNPMYAGCNPMCRRQRLAEASVSELHEALTMAQAAWKEERQQREALEEALAGSLGEVEQRSAALHRTLAAHGVPDDGMVGSPHRLQALAATGAGGGRDGGGGSGGAGGGARRRRAPR